MAVFQNRFFKQDCENYNTHTKEFIAVRESKIKCYNPSYLDFGKFGESEGFSYSDVSGMDTKIYERHFTTDGGYYFFMDTEDLKKAKTEVMEKLGNGWVDSYTKYVGIIINFYDPILHIMMYYLVLYDFRFGSK